MLDRSTPGSRQFRAVAAGRCEGCGQELTVWLLGTSSGNRHTCRARIRLVSVKQVPVPIDLGLGDAAQCALCARGVLGIRTLVASQRQEVRWTACGLSLDRPCVLPVAPGCRFRSSHRSHCRADDRSGVSHLTIIYEAGGQPPAHRQIRTLPPVGGRRGSGQASDRSDTGRMRRVNGPD
jgi:hypothetical protein